MRAHSLLPVLATLAWFTFLSRTCIAAEPPGGEVSLRVQSVRLGRAIPESNRKSPRHYNGDGSPGVSLQLAMTLRDGTMLPVAQDAVTVETFVDDTYENLLAGDRGGYYGGRNYQCTLSDDSRTLLFTVTANRGPTEDAGRVFVRGVVQARVSRGKTKTASGQTPLTVGREVACGEFRTTIRSVTAFGSGANATVTLGIEGDASRIQKIHVLDGEKLLNDERVARFQVFDSGGEVSSRSVTLRELPKGPATIEYTYTEKVELVSIPFEAQVDIGVTKAGPIQARQPTAPKRKADRIWPPPQEEKSGLFVPSRSPFNPDALPQAAAAKPITPVLGNAAVDLFSVTVAKPASADTNGAVWKQPPSPQFFATGFTVARLMLSTPGACILSVPADGVSITRFEDDKGKQLDTAIYRDAYSSFSQSPSLAIRRSPDGQQALVTVSLVSSPTHGATRCTLAGQIQARVARGPHTSSSDRFELLPGMKFVAGPFSGVVREVRQMAPLTPAVREADGIHVRLSLEGPTEKIHSIELLDAAGVPLVTRRTVPGESVPENIEKTNSFLRLSTMPAGSLTLRIVHYDLDEVVKLPFEISTGIGL